MQIALIRLGRSIFNDNYINKHLNYSQKIMSAMHMPLKSWKEQNRIRKEERKKWREEKLIKKVKKEELQEIQQVKENETEPKYIRQNLSTISIAIPGSILDNAQSPTLRTSLAGQIARAACIFKVDEIIVFNDEEITDNQKRKMKIDPVLGESSPGCLQLARILQYMECPQYLRKHFFPLHKDLEDAGKLHPLNAPHHLKAQDISLYREGIVTNKPIKLGKGSLVNVGLLNDVHVDKVLTPGIRVTVKIPPNQENPKKLKGFVVPPDVPRSDTGVYWGYTVRLANNVSDIMIKSPYPNNYDLTIGTSDKGTLIDDIPDNSLEYEHVLIIFGGILGLEAAIEADANLDISNPALLFDQYLNVCPEQGSKTIRTEEAVLISLTALRTKLHPKYTYVSNS